MSEEILEDLKWMFEDILDVKEFEEDDQVQLWLSKAEIETLLKIIKEKLGDKNE